MNENETSREGGDAKPTQESESGESGESSSEAQGKSKEPKEFPVKMVNHRDRWYVEDNGNIWVLSAWLSWRTEELSVPARHPLKR